MDPRCRKPLVRLSAFAWALLILAGCLGNRARGPAEVRVEGATEIVSLESGLFGRPTKIAVDDSGNLWVLDNMLGQILVLTSHGELVRSIGGAGSGPREFRRPQAFIVSGDTVRVADVGNGRLLTLALHSEYARSIPLPPAAALGPLALTRDGRLLLGTQGLQGALAAYYDASGTLLGTLGQPPAETPMILDVRGMKQEILAGEVPAFFRNLVHPVFAPDGAMWLILTGEALVQQYDASGTQRLSVSLAAPQLERIWEGVVARNRETLNDSRHIDGPVYVLDAAVVDQELWMLLNMPASEPAVMLALTTNGTFERTLVFTRVLGAESFVIDAARDRVYFTIPSNASVVAAPLPGGWH
jgi:hypothetical protein